jgi:twitching motility protein PilT
MAALDKVLDSMAPSGAHLLTLKAGEVPLLHTAAGSSPVHKQPLTAAQVLSYLRELAGPAERQALEGGGPASFLYRTFRIDVEKVSGDVSAKITPVQKSAGEKGGATAGAAGPGGGASIDGLFRKMIQAGASDLHLTMGEKPWLRLSGEMTLMDDPPLTKESMEGYLWPICPERNRDEFEKVHDTDFAYEVPGLARFRCNYFMDRTGMGAVFRQIPTQIPTIDQLGLPRSITELCWLSKGFVVVTGPTGSGKSTTLAALVKFINQNRKDHIVTIEDPIEFVHPNDKCLINQREVGDHTTSFRRALRSALRQDPDIVLVGEMRDLETISIAIETAETGHLVFGTLHTTTAPSTIDRIIDQFPADRQSQVRVMLSETLKAVIAQTLCKKKGGGRIAAFEILVVNSATSNLIREGKTYQIPSVMQTQKGLGNRALNDSLMELVKKGLVDPKEAYIKAVDKAGLVGIFERNNVPLEMAEE